MKFKRLVASVRRQRREFLLAGEPVENSVNVYWNGLLQTPEQDWIRAGRVVRLNEPVDDGVIHITYCV